MRSKLGIAVLAIVLLIASSMALDRMIVTDEEALDQLWEDLVQALADEDTAAIGRLFLPALSYRGPSPMRDGDRHKALDRLDEFFDLAQNTKVTASREITVQSSSVGVIRADGHIRFEYGDGAVLYKMTTEVSALNSADGWRVQSIQVSQLNPGLF